MTEGILGFGAQPLFQEPTPPATSQMFKFRENDGPWGLEKWLCKLWARHLFPPQRPDSLVSFQELLLAVKPNLQWLSLFSCCLAFTFMEPFATWKTVILTPPYPMSPSKSTWAFTPRLFYSLLSHLPGFELLLLSLLFPPYWAPPFSLLVIISAVITIIIYHCYQWWWLEHWIKVLYPWKKKVSSEGGKRQVQCESGAKHLSVSRYNTIQFRNQRSNQPPLSAKHNY